MSSQVYIPSALRIGEVVALALGFGLSTFAVFARLYTQKCLTKSIKIEDCTSTSFAVQKRCYFMVANFE